MKKVMIPLVSIILFTGLILMGCQGLNYISGSGNIQTKQFDLKDFNSIEISDSFQFEIKQSSSCSFIASCRENIVPYLDIFVSGKTLVIQLKPGFHTNGDLNVTVTLPEIESINLSGASKGSARGFISSKALKLRISGASQFDADLETGDTQIDISGLSQVTGNLKTQLINLKVSGASRCELKGSGGDGFLEISGASESLLRDFQLLNVNIDVSGASTAVIRTDGVLNLNVSGASTLEYYGKPSLHQVNVTGASKINSRL